MIPREAQISFEVLMLIEGVVKDDLDLSWKRAAAVVLGGLVAFSFVRRNFLGIQNMLDGLAGVDGHRFTNLKIGG